MVYLLKKFFYDHPEIICKPECKLKFKDLIIELLCESRCGGTTVLILKLSFKGKEYVVKVMQEKPRNEIQILEELMSKKIIGVVKYFGTIEKLQKMINNII